LKVEAAAILKFNLFYAVCGGGVKILYANFIASTANINDQIAADLYK